MAASPIVADSGSIPPQDTWDQAHDVKMHAPGDAIPLNGNAAPADDQRADDAAHVTGQQPADGAAVTDGADSNSGSKQADGPARGEKLIKVLVWSLCIRTAPPTSPLLVCLLVLHLTDVCNIRPYRIEPDFFSSLLAVPPAVSQSEQRTTGFSVMAPW